MLLYYIRLSLKRYSEISIHNVEYVRVGEAHDAWVDLKELRRSILVMCGVLKEKPSEHVV